MIKTILGKKLGMTQVYDAHNVLTPVTIVIAGPCPVVQIRTKEIDGYSAVQLGFDTKKLKNCSAAEKAHARKGGLDLPPRVLAEVRLTPEEVVKIGDVVTVAVFEEGEMLDVIGTTKGKGFQGVVKRWRVAGGPASHGSMFHRRIGSIGMRQTPGRSWKNQAMPGHMGSERRTVQGLRLIKIISERNILLIRGAVPGAAGSDVVVRSSIKVRN